ncbi:MAG: phosphotransferase [Shimia sp.]
MGLNQALKTAALKGFGVTRLKAARLERRENRASEALTEFRGLSPFHRDVVSRLKPGARITGWTSDALPASSESRVFRHIADLDTAPYNQGNAIRVTFIEKQSQSPEEQNFYKSQHDRGNPFPYAPAVYACHVRASGAGGEYPFVSASEYVRGRPLSRLQEGDIEALADAMYAVNNLKLENGVRRGLEFAEAIGEVCAAKVFQNVARLTSDAGWASLHRRLDALRPPIERLDMTMRPAHGDLHPRNFIVQSMDGTKIVRLFDWEWVAIRPVGTDLYQYLARSFVSLSLESLYEDLEHLYLARAARLGVPAREVRIAANCGALRRASIGFRTRTDKPDVVRHHFQVLKGTLSNLERLLQ